MIPKNSNVCLLLDLHPIGLCNNVYKILAKVICANVKPILPNIIEPNQGTFIQGQGCVDNVVIVLEVLH